MWVLILNNITLKVQAIEFVFYPKAKQVIG